MIRHQLEEEHRRAQEMAQSALAENEAAHDKVSQLRKQHEWGGFPKDFRGGAKETLRGDGGEALP
jgi:hypothetical protein